MSQVDLELKCIECGASFVFTSGEQEFFKKKGFTSQPKKCLDCRAKGKAQGTSKPRAGAVDGPRYAAVCSRCQKNFDAPFEPQAGRPVFCRDCYKSNKV